MAPLEKVYRDFGSVPGDLLEPEAPEGSPETGRTGGQEWESMRARAVGGPTEEGDTNPAGAAAGLMGHSPCLHVSLSWSKPDPLPFSGPGSPAGSSRASLKPRQ